MAQNLPPSHSTPEHSLTPLNSVVAAGIPVAYKHASRRRCKTCYQGEEGNLRYIYYTKRTELQQWRPTVDLHQTKMNECVASTVRGKGRGRSYIEGKLRGTYEEA